MFYSEINCVFTMLNRKREKNLGVPNNLLNLYAHRKQHTLMCICLQGVLLPDRQTFRSDSTHEDKPGVEIRSIQLGANDKSKWKIQASNV